MKCIYTAWCITFIFFSIPCMAPTGLSIKTHAEKIIGIQQNLRKICKEAVHDKEQRKAIKTQLNKIICLCNKAYSQAGNEECAKTFLIQAQELTDQIRSNPFIKPAIAAL